MAVYDWGNDKNALLKRERGVTFEQVVVHIESGDILDIVAHPNPARYPGQQVLIVRMGDYAYAVPFVRSGESWFLKTIIPSRKLTKQYLG
jgi:hypothetical protein